MKKGIGLFPTVVWIVAISSFSFSASYSGGAGTVEDPFRISNLDDWNQLTLTPADWSAGGIAGVNHGNWNGGSLIQGCYADCQVEPNSIPPAVWSETIWD
ncbi:MAG: hypothetical protein GX455_11820 [Phycisphaerae bacterium]|nr:hypothetical protein [Phycisphaerae bacterium]